MAKYYALHEIRNGGKKPVQPGQEIELTDDEAAALSEYGAISLDPPVKAQEPLPAGKSASTLAKEALAGKGKGGKAE